MTPEQIQNDFDTWWHNEGSGITPLKEHNWEEHTQRVTEIAWKNAIYKHEELAWKRSLELFGIKHPIENTNKPNK